MDNPTQHLDANRRLVVGRALLAGAAGLVPVPFLDEALSEAVRSALIRRLADVRHVDVDNNAVAALATPYPSRLLGAAGLGAAALGGAKRIWRRVAASILIVRRVDEAVQTFQIGTLFDHYCARHHVGLGLDGQRATVLRMCMDKAVRTAQSETINHAFRDGLRAAGSWVATRPRAFMRLFRRRDASAPLDAERVEQRIEEVEATRPVHDAVDRVESEMAAARRGYLAALLAAFDIAWAPYRLPQLESHR